MNKDQVKGRVEEAKGKIKETAGRTVGNHDLEDRGTAQKVGGLQVVDGLFLFSDRISTSKLVLHGWNLVDTLRRGHSADFLMDRHVGSPPLFRRI